MMTPVTVTVCLSMDKCQNNYFKDSSNVLDIKLVSNQGTLMGLPVPPGPRVTMLSAPLLQGWLMFKVTQRLGRLKACAFKGLA
eukprot:g49746.t1